MRPRVLAVVPARMGSERLPRKNLLEIEPGLTLVQHAVDCARHSGVVDMVMVSSDEALPVMHAMVVKRPASLSGPTSDIAAAVSHAYDQTGQQWDIVLTLQPAVLARSPLIVRRIVEAMTEHGLDGAVTAARTTPWLWRPRGRRGLIGWAPDHYPRSQDAGRHLVEVNAVQATTREWARQGVRWNPPLGLLELPPWAASLDVDTPEDMAAARDLWPWAKQRLETWSPEVHLVDLIHLVNMEPQ